MDPTSFIAAFALGGEPKQAPVPPPKPVVAKAPEQPLSIFKHPLPLAVEALPPVPPKGVVFTPPELKAPPKMSEPKPSPYVAPALWSLRDAAGITWTSPDRASLERYVAERNRARFVYYPAQAVGCPNGRCPR